ncbi:MAG: 2'-5' RNA ligase family protein [Sedimentisphaerales bacterium]
MSKKAVDVVLLPEEAMMEEAIEANAELVKKFGKKIVLNKENCLPHISLAMGCVDEEDIASVERILRSIAKEYSLGDLRVLGVRSSTNAAGEKVSAFEVEETKELQLLHETIMKRLAPYLSRDVTADMICGYGNDEVEGATLLWIKNYREKSSFEEFFPHITIGYGELSNPSIAMKFTASRLVLCQLGNHCTCRKILVSIELSGK